MWIPGKPRDGAWYGVAFGKSAGSPPAAPDPTTVANAQGAANVAAVDESAKVNRIDQVSPFGSLNYSTSTGQPTFNQSGFDQANQAYQTALQQYNSVLANPGAGGVDPISGLPNPTASPGAAPVAPNQADFFSPTQQVTATTSLSPQEQQIFDQQMALANQLTGAAQNVGNQVTAQSQQPFNLAANETPLPSAGDLAGNLQDVQNSVYARNTQYLDPQYAQMQHDLNNSLTNQGIPQGSEAWTRAQGDLQRQQQAAYSDARDAAVQAGTSAQAQELSSGIAQQQQEGQNYITQQTQPMNELAAFLQGAPALQQPSFGQPAQYQVAPADVTGAFGLSTQAQQAAFANQSQQAAAGNANATGAATTAAAVAAMAFF